MPLSSSGRSSFDSLLKTKASTAAATSTVTSGTMIDRVPSSSSPVPHCSGSAISSGGAAIISSSSRSRSSDAAFVLLKIADAESAASAARRSVAASSVSASPGAGARSIASSTVGCRPIRACRCRSTRESSGWARTTKHCASRQRIWCNSSRSSELFASGATVRSTCLSRSRVQAAIRSGPSVPSTPSASSIRIWLRRS